MFIVMGATGHVGSAVADNLLDQGQPVTAITRHAEAAAGLRDRGAVVAEVDVADVTALHEVFAAGSRAFVLNPPADPATDTDEEERRTAAAIAAALEGSGLERVVVASTYGARPGRRTGDLTTLYDLEQAVLRCGLPTAINRGAYYFTNWDAGLDSAVDDGTIMSMVPADLPLPMVAPADVGAAAARRLSEPDTPGVHYVEGPRRYTPRDVAAAFSRALNKTVDVTVIDPDERQTTFKQMGFSNAAAESYDRMTDVTIDQPDLPDAPERGTITIDDHVAELVKQAN